MKPYLELTAQEIESVIGLMHKGCASDEIVEIFRLRPGELDAIMADKQKERQAQLRKIKKMLKAQQGGGE